jgi:hypothetical protein
MRCKKGAERHTLPEREGGWGKKMEKRHNFYLKYRVARAREQLEAEIVQGAARLESDIMERHQKSIEGTYFI